MPGSHCCIIVSMEPTSPGCSSPRGRMLTHAHPFLTRPMQVPLAFLGILLGIGGCTKEEAGLQVISPYGGHGGDAHAERHPGD